MTNGLIQDRGRGPEIAGTRITIDRHRRSSRMKMPNEQTTDPITDSFACTVCGCVCDDLRITVADGRIRQAGGACTLAEHWLLNQTIADPALAQIDGVDVPLEQAVERAAQILRNARAPLVFGLTGIGTEGQRAAVALADKIGAIIDTAASQHPLILAMQEAGMSTCTLGEVRNRADLVIFWGADPVLTHPRLLERIVLAAVPDPLRQELIARDRSRRTVVVVDVEQTATAEVADRFLPMEEARQFETLWALRSLVRKPPISADLAKAGMSPADLHELARLMTECRYGVVFIGQELSQQGPRTVEALLRLVADLNDRTRFYAQGLLGEGAGGADSVLAWQTGYPCGVDLAHGYPRSNPGEFSAQNLLEHAEVDACLLMGSHPLGNLSRSAISQLDRLPTIVLDFPGAPSPRPNSGLGSVRITTAVPGIHMPETAYRMDGVPIPLRAVLPESYPRVATVLQSISDRIRYDNQQPSILVSR
jgi:formylmethanofuran dehydrogenase subunit B